MSLWPPGSRRKGRQNFFLQFLQGLEGYFRDPGFDQNTCWLRDLGKRNISQWETGFYSNLGSGIRQNLSTGCGIFCLYVGNSGNHTFELQMGMNQACVKCCLLTNQTMECTFLINFCFIFFVVFVNKRGFWESGEKKKWDAGFLSKKKRSGNAGSAFPLPDPVPIPSNKRSKGANKLNLPSTPLLTFFLCTSHNFLQFLGGKACIRQGCPGQHLCSQQGES